MSINRSGKTSLTVIGACFLACTAKSVTQPPPAPVIDHIQVTPPTVSLDVGLNQQLHAVALDASGDTVVGVAIVWASDADTVATVDQHGTVTGILPGVAHITATGSAKIGVSLVTVPTPAISSITLQPNSGSYEIGAPVDLVPTVIDVLGHIVDPPLVWLSNSSAVATVTSAGEVTGITTGSVRITASIGAIQGIADLVIIPMSVASIAVTPQTVPLFVGETAPLSAKVESALGTVLTDRLVTWHSRDELTASVSAAGEVTAIAPGSVWVVGECEGILDSAQVTVSVRPPAGYTIEVVNNLLRPVEIAINGSDVSTLPPGATLDMFRTPETMVRVAWALVPLIEVGRTIGEAVSDTFAQAAGPDGASLHFEVGATLTNGDRLVTPGLQNTSSTTVQVGFSMVETTTPCACILPSGLPESTDFGYWFLPPGQTLRVYGRNDSGHTGPFVSIPIPPADVDPLTGLWHFIITSGP